MVCVIIHRTLNFISQWLPQYYRTVVTARFENKIQPSEIRFLRGIKGCARADQDIRDELSIAEVYTRKRKEHAVGVSNEMILKQALTNKTIKIRKMARPQRRWGRYLKTDKADSYYSPM